MEEKEFTHPILQFVPKKYLNLYIRTFKGYLKHAEEPHTATGKVLHFYGQFTDELPKTFQPDGPNGHQYLECSSLEEAEQRTQELRAFIFKKWPHAFEVAGKGWYYWVIDKPDGDEQHFLRQMNLEFIKALRKKPVRGIK